MKNITFYSSRGQQYAKISASSFRDSDGKIKKRNDGIYLGRVIDKDNLVFYSKQRGLFSYDPVSNSFLPVDEFYSTELPHDHRKRPKVCLDFGDSFVLSELLHLSGYDDVLQSIPYRNKDTLFAMVLFYILQNKANDHASIWYKGNIVNLFYPKANLTSQRISDFLKSIGRREVVEDFFTHHIEWIKKNVLMIRLS